MLTPGGEIQATECVELGGVLVTVTVSQGSNVSVWVRERERETLHICTSK